MDMQTVMQAGKVTIHVAIRGAGATVVLLPGGGRGVEDYDDLSQRLVQAGYRAMLPQPGVLAGVPVPWTASR